MFKIKTPKATYERFICQAEKTRNVFSSFLAQMADFIS